MMKIEKRFKQLVILLVITASSTAVGFTYLKMKTGLPFLMIANQSLRIVAAWIGASLYSRDIEEARSLALERGQVVRNSGSPPFVPEQSNAPHLLELMLHYDLKSVIGKADDEYDAQLKLAAWVGTRFEHGTDIVPGGRQVCNPVAVFSAGESGSKFWCEIAAYSMIHASIAVGWKARMISASVDGYSWDHAVAELWSNQFNKWFVVDTDFNVVFEKNGEPLSAWELVHEAPELKRKGQLTTRRFAIFKNGLKEQDLLNLYAFAYADFRTDWCTRALKPASPAGGDFNSRWTSRDMHRTLLTAIPKSQTRTEFEPQKP